MRERKNIDRLFQEKFKDFEVNPPEALWNNIEAHLDKDKSRRVIPLWWKLSGIVAVLTVGWLLFQNSFTDKDIPANTVTVEETNNAVELESRSAPNHPKNSRIHSQDKNPENAVVNSDIRKNTPNEASKKSLVSEDNYNQTTPIKSGINDAFKKNAVADISATKKRKATKVSRDSSLVVKNEEDIIKEENALAIGSKSEMNQNKNNTQLFEPSKEISLESLKGNRNTVTENATVTAPKDSTKTKETPVNPLEELLAAKQEDKKKQETKQSKWQINSNVAPIVMGALSGGSAIDSTLAGNNKTFNTNIGFGLGVSYAVSPKLTIRTGLNKVNMSYNTNDVFYFASMENTRTMSALNPSGAGHNIQIENGNSFSPSASLGPDENGFLSFEQTIVNKNKGYINQEIGYLEMPIEMTYSLIAKKFGLKVIGGFSTLFLQDNTIALVSGNRTAVLGEANNLNNIHFSTNIGLGVKYDILKSFEFHIEPTFKYQINTFSNDTGNFRPYLFGVYSGFSYKF